MFEDVACILNCFVIVIAQRNSMKFNLFVNICVNQYEGIFGTSGFKETLKHGSVISKCQRHPASICRGP